MRGLFLGISIVILLAGCGQPKFYYDRPGATPAMFERESAECKRWARQTASPFSLSIGLGAGRDETSADSFAGAGDDQSYHAYQDCLKLKGWKQVPKPQQ